jgi:acetyl esterase/lipase
VALFRQTGADNAAFCWCYEPAGPGDFDERNAPGAFKWFPGADVIDWFAIDWFNKEDFSGPLQDSRLGGALTAHGRSRKFLDMAAAHGKPVIIAESAPCRYDLSDPQQAEAAWQEWFLPYFRILEERPQIKWFHLISYNWTQSSYFAQSGWKNNEFTANADLLRRLIEELRQPRYLHSGEKEKLAAYAAITLAPVKPEPATTAPVAPTAPPAGAGPAAETAASKAELAKWDNPAAHLPRSGPGGTEWDAAYRSFIQTDASATAKGLPAHAEAANQIKADAAKGAANLQKHKGWVLFIKHFSQAYRPEAATADLKRLYQELVAMEFGARDVQAALPFEGDARLTIHRDVVYGKTHPASQKLDAYLVKSPRPTPVLMEIHGGGWRRGQKSQFVYADNLIGRILEAGISVVSVDYRLTPEHRFPAQMEDTARALQFVRSKAKEWNLAADRIIALGGSAGAHLSAWIALHDDLAKPDSSDPVERESTRLRGFVALAGPMDLTRVRPTELARQPLRGPDFANAFTAAFGCTAEQYERDEATRKAIREASPLFLVTPDDPPGMVLGAAGAEMQAGRHPPVPETINDPHSAWQSVLLADAMTKAGIRVVCRLGPQVGMSPEADNAVVLDFVRRQLFDEPRSK